MSSFVQAKAAQSTATASPAISYTSTPTSGNLLAFCVQSNAALNSFADSAGNAWTKVNGFGGSTPFVAYYCKSNGLACTITLTMASSSNLTNIAIGEWVPPSKFVADTLTFKDVVGTSTTFMAAGVGELAVLFDYAAGDAILGMSGTGVVSRASVPFYLAVGDKLSTSAGSNLWTMGTSACICCASPEFYTFALVFKTPAAGSVIFDSMNE